MAQFSSYQHGQFSWIDLMSKDMEQAIEFYGTLFDWQAELQDTQGGPPYAIFQLQGQRVAGLGQLSDEMKAAGTPPSWNSYVNVEDIEAVVQQAGELGGKPLMPVFKVMDAGSMAVLQDPQGAVFSLWEKDQHFGAELTNVPNTWSWNELLCNDAKAAAEFYRSLLGWDAKLDPSAENPYWGFQLNDRLNGGMMEISSEMGPIPPHWGVYIAVADIDSSTEQLAKLGGQLLRPIFEVHVGHIGICQDTQGAMFNIIQMSVPADE